MLVLRQSIALVDEQFIRPRENILAADNRAEIFDQSFHIET